MERTIDMIDEAGLVSLATRAAQELGGGEVISLRGDVGAGKTTFTRALAHQLGVEGAIQSPTFTIANHYDTPRGLHLAHYDFYRLSDPGIMADELAEAIEDDNAVIVIEWGESVADIIPKDHLLIELIPTSETTRQLKLTAGGSTSQKLVEVLA